MSLCLITTLEQFVLAPLAGAGIFSILGSLPRRWSASLHLLVGRGTMYPRGVVLVVMQASQLWIQYPGQRLWQGQALLPSCLMIGVFGYCDRDCVLSGSRCLQLRGQGQSPVWWLVQSSVTVTGTVSCLVVDAFSCWDRDWVLSGGWSSPTTGSADERSWQLPAAPHKCLPRLLQSNIYPYSHHCSPQFLWATKTLVSKVVFFRVAI